MLIAKTRMMEHLRASEAPFCVVLPADKYENAHDLCIVTCYFNPCRYSGLLENYRAFRRSIVDSGLHLITVECAFHDSPFELTSEENVIQVRSNTIIWQKECLLNIAIEAAKLRFKKVAWLDADVLFEDPKWAKKTSKLLDDYQVVQPFTGVALLSSGMDHYEGPPFVTNGVASILARDSNLLTQPYDRHGHTGYAWAARVEALSEGLFDGCLLGCGDHLMAHAMFGDFDSECVYSTFGDDVASRNYFERWGRAFFARVKGRVGHIPGTVLPRWHGSQKNRNYLRAAQKLARFGVDPATDLRKNSQGCWEWVTNRSAVKNYIAEYFELRKEDDR